MKLTRFIIAAIATLILTGCGALDDNDSSSSRLIGNWTYSYPNQCEEITAFNEDNTWQTTSLDSVESGIYLFIENNSGEKHTLDITVLADNGLPDCDGASNAIASGTAFSIYTVFLSPTIMEFYFTRGAFDPDYTLTKSQ